MVLVSDGLETCDVDPCALAAELAMGGVDFTVHVIGFDISAEDQDRLRCLADKTGGLFLAAGSAGALRDALFATVAQVKEPPSPLVADPGTATLTGPPSVPVGSAFQVQWEGPDSRDDFIAIAEKGSKELRYRDYTYTRDGSPLKVRAPSDPGIYEVRYILGRGSKLLAKTTIDIKAVTAKVNAPGSAEIGETFEVSWEGPDNKSDYISIARPDQRPGIYEVRYILGRGNKLLDKTTIEITP